MIATFHTICIIARYVYVVLSESLLARIHGNVNEEVDALTFKGGKYLVEGDCYIEDTGPKFVPQLFVQRYLTVKEALVDEEWKGSIRKVVEFGCANLGFFPYLKKLPGVQEILEVDLDNEILVQHYCKVSPLNTDYLFQRNEPLTVFVLEGNIAHTDKCLAGCDAVVCIELIEHLHPDVLEEVPYTVFGVIKPRVAIFTTPNVEFNVLFPNSKGFRHPDHKFEWTRAQFKSWANNIILRYPDYKVSLHGIGWGPDDTENVGACSQMAVFGRRSSPPSDGHPSNNPVHDVRINSTEQKYHLLRENVYPFHVDTRTDRQKIKDQADYSLRMLSTADEFMEDVQILIPLTRVLPFVSEWNPTIKELENILKEAGWEIVTLQSGSLAVVFPADDTSMSEEPIDSEEPQELCNEEEGHLSFENWDDYEFTSEQKWDCDSLDPNFQNGDVSTSSWSQLPVMQDVEYRGESEPSTSGLFSTCEDDPLKFEGACPSSTSVNIRPVIHENFAGTFEVPCFKNDSPNSDTQCNNLDVEHSVRFSEKICDSLCFSNCEPDKCENIVKTEEPLQSGDTHENYSCVAAVTAKDITQLQSAQDSSHRTADIKLSESYHHSDVPLQFSKSSPSNSLCLNLQTEVQGANIESNKKQEGLTDSPAAGSVSLEEPNDRLADSGYPNSTSAQDMDLDLTPEQVDELFTENDAVTDHPPDHHLDSVSVSSRDSDSISEQQLLQPPPPVVMPQPDVLFEEAMNVENGDVANNNRDGEGNNVLAVGALLNEGGGEAGDDNAVAVGIVLPENLDDLIPLIAAAEDIDNDNEIELNVVEPFPPWLLNMLGLANGGGGGVVGEEAGDNVHQQESSDDEDSDNNPVIDEGLGDEYNLDSSSLSDTCPSDLGPESDIGGEVVAARP